MLSVKNGVKYVSASYPGSSVSDCLGTITFVVIPSEYKSLVKVLVTVYYPCSQINDT